MSSDFEAYLVRRLDDMERRVRRSRWHQFGFSVAVIAQGIVLLYLLLPVSRIGVPKYVEASHYALVDSAGRTRGEWGTDLGQGPSLRLLTEDGQIRVWLVMNHDGSADMILQAGNGRAAIVSAHDDETGLLLTDLEGREAGLKLNDKQPGVQQFDQPPRRRP